MKTAFLCLLVLGYASAVDEYVALVPSAGSSSIVKWTEVNYETTSNSADDVSFNLINSTNKDIGTWYDLDLSVGGGGAASLTAKIIGSKMYTYVQKTATSGAGGGCCADTLRVYDRDTGNYTEWDLDSILATVYGSGVSFHKATHTFDVEEEDGVVFCYMMVQYTDSSINALGNSVVVFSTEDGSVKKTADGEPHFNFYDEIGTLDTNSSNDIFKVQYYKNTATRTPEEWHGNGMLRFTTASGQKLLALTHRMDSEAVIVSDPYSYTKANGGGAVLQRFGTPKHFKGDGSGTVDYHHFGVKSTVSAWTGGCHNLWYTQRSPTTALKGQETLTLFVNSVSGGTSSFAYEFALKLTKQQDGIVYTDDVFSTGYVAAACGFTAQAQGGARVIADGVYIVASGVGANGVMEVVDLNGGKKDVAYPSSSSADDDETGSVIGLYDPFIRVVV